VALGLAVVLIGIPCIADYERIRGNMHACEASKKAHPPDVELNNESEVAFVPCFVEGGTPLWERGMFSLGFLLLVSALLVLGFDSAGFLWRKLQTPL
jgi:hypothetical protein